MNKQEMIERIKIEQAWVDGEAIEYQNCGDNYWCPASTPSFKWEYKKYRIKRKPREIWIDVYKPGQRADAYFDIDQAYQAGEVNGAIEIAVKFVEEL